MKTLEKRRTVKNGIARMVIVAIAFVIEVAMVYGAFAGLNKYAEWISIATRFVGFVIVLCIYSSDRTSTIKMPWIMLIAATPIAGVFLYLMIGLNPRLRGKKRKYNILHKFYTSKLESNEKIKEQLRCINPYSYRISEYISNYGGFPLFEIKELHYYKSANDGLAAQKEAFKHAKNYIFIEYHAIENAQIWQEIQIILEEKAQEGIDVRVLYDDMGSIGFVNTDFARQLRKKGIKCEIFNAFVPGLNLFLNNRDHRKITVVDGEIAFTGGYNLADEYFNIKNPYGFWKDTGIKVTGRAASSFTAMFLEMWSLADKSKEPSDDDLLLNCGQDVTDEPAGFVQPYGESPMVEEKFAENIYISMIEAAKDYVWFVTPYLILTDEMISALTNASKRGVDVRVITPGIPDKKIIYSVTRSFYHVLCKNGVKVYEYSPGFCHCKMCISDDERAISGTINLDYRSLYHHFENGCYFTNCSAVLDMKKDYEGMCMDSKEVTAYYADGLGTFLSFKQLLLRFVAQLL